MAEVPDLKLLYEGGDKSKPLSPLVTNENGALVGRNLGHNSPVVISEWVDMVYVEAGKNKIAHKNNNNRCRRYDCDDKNCGSTLQTSMLFPFNFPPIYSHHLMFLSLVTCRQI